MSSWCFFYTVLFLFHQRSLRWKHVNILFVRLDVFVNKVNWIPIKTLLLKTKTTGVTNWTRLYRIQTCSPAVVWSDFVCTDASITGLIHVLSSHSSEESWPRLHRRPSSSCVSKVTVLLVYTVWSDHMSTTVSFSTGFPFYFDVACLCEPSFEVFSSKCCDGISKQDAGQL